MAHNKVVVEVEEEVDMNSLMVAEEAMNREVAVVVMNREVAVVAMSKVEDEDVVTMIKETEEVEEVKYKEAGQMVVAVVLVDITKMEALEILAINLEATRVVEEGIKEVDIKAEAVDIKVEVDTREEAMEATKVHPTLVVVIKEEAINKTTDFKMVAITMTEEVAVEAEEEAEVVVVEEEGKVGVGVAVVHKHTTKVVSLSSTFSMEVINIISLVLDKEDITPVEIILVSH